jgi:1-deoxy-D-xylulose-5-phosphate reductoisomerase
VSSLGVAVLGSTGSIGLNTLDVLDRHADKFSVELLAARSSVQRLKEQCLKYRPAVAFMSEQASARELAKLLKAAGCATEVRCGEDALVQAIAQSSVDVVVAGIVGAAGLASTLAAARAGKRILLANKEALVMSGSLVMEAVRIGGATLIPLDSEHNAIFQCMPAGCTAGAASRGVKRILLTASGGPFLRTRAEELAHVTPAQACAHPRWVMGRKISVDSATLMNKGLELIEACLLFAVPPERVEVLVHPQSIVHSMVEYTDGSVLAQLGNPDMRTPIAHALAWPERMESGVESLDLVRAARLEFEAPDVARFPCLRLAKAAAHSGGTAATVLNAANEVAVQAFLDNRCGFRDIPAVVERVLDQHSSAPVNELEEVLEADRWARERAHDALTAVTGVYA